jgi:hypothetical protein
MTIEEKRFRSHHLGGAASQSVTDWELGSANEIYKLDEGVQWIDSSIIGN